MKRNRKKEERSRSQTSKRASEAACVCETNILLSRIFIDSVKTICEEAKENKTLDSLLPRDYSVVEAETPIQQAAFYGHYEIVLALMEYMFDKPAAAAVDNPINVPLYDGWPLIYLFAANDYAKGIEALVKFGADLNQIGQQGHLALSLAIVRSFVGDKQKYTETIKVLLAHVPKVDIGEKTMTPLNTFMHHCLYWKNELPKLVGQYEKTLKAHTVASYPIMFNRIFYDYYFLIILISALNILILQVSCSLVVLIF